MKNNTQAKKQIVSMRISAEERETLNDMMKYLKVDRVSDLMREALKQISASLDICRTSGQTAPWPSRT